MKVFLLSLLKALDRSAESHAKVTGLKNNISCQLLKGNRQKFHIGWVGTLTLIMGVRQGSGLLLKLFNRSAHFQIPTEVLWQLIVPLWRDRVLTMTASVVATTQPEHQRLIKTKIKQNVYSFNKIML